VALLLRFLLQAWENIVYTVVRNIIFIFLVTINVEDYTSYHILRIKKSLIFLNFVLFFICLI